MSELRQDRVTGRWVIIAPERGGRPHEAHHDTELRRPALSYDPSCPFCPGNEHLLPGIIHETPSDLPTGWLVRVVPNKYPALEPRGGSNPEIGASRVAAGFGYHEVIIETARHDVDLSALPDENLRAVVRTYRHRFVELSARSGIKAVLLFRNRGGGGGASLHHPHSQFVAIGMMPPRLAAIAARSHDEFEQTGRCVTCVDLDEEIADGRRVVEATERFVVLVPFAAATPFELIITPRRHLPSFGYVDDRDCAELGDVLRRSLQCLDALLGDCPYNFVLGSVVGSDGDSARSHWRLRIVPRAGELGGFELGSGIPINPSLPERDVELLRTSWRHSPRR